MRVLLLSPVDGRDPRGGDVTYTQVLRENPPPGVEYVTYAEALADGRLRFRGRRPRSWNDVSVGDFAMMVALKVHRVLAGRIAFCEPPVFAELQEGEFDVVHQHLFSVRFVGRRPPTVMTSGMPLPPLYAHRERWSPARIRVAGVWRRLEVAALGLQVPGVSAQPNTLDCVFTEQYASVASRATGRSVRVVRQSLPRATWTPRPVHPVSAAFIGGDWVRKGGPAAAELMLELLRSGTIELAMIYTADPTEVPPHVRARSDVAVSRLVARMDLLENVLPVVDLLVLPTTLDCGVPYTVLEGLDAGCRVLLGNSRWLDSALEGAAVAVSPLDRASLASAARGLLEQSEIAASAHRADLLDHRFSMAALHEGLLEAYREVAQRDGGSEGHEVYPGMTVTPE